MPIATRLRNDPMPQLAALIGLTVRHESDAAVMAAVQGKSEPDMTARFAAGHRAYVAMLNGQPAAFGWVGTRVASIGELQTEFTIPEGERYLWNFVTLESHRGLGIYPRLLQEIVRAEECDAERFWIIYAPENHASGSGIRKAGFMNVAELSFDAAGRPALQAMDPSGVIEASRVLGVPIATETLTQCWRCARAGRFNMRCAEGSCACDYQLPRSGCAG
jgi:ribosomal protein S18 acetylase RimI-like enzyme